MFFVYINTLIIHIKDFFARKTAPDLEERKSMRYVTTAQPQGDPEFIKHFLNIAIKGKIGS